MAPPTAADVCHGPLQAGASRNVSGEEEEGVDSERARTMNVAKAVQHRPDVTPPQLVCQFLTAHIR